MNIFYEFMTVVAIALSTLAHHNRTKREDADRLNKIRQLTIKRKQEIELEMKEYKKLMKPGALVSINEKRWLSEWCEKMFSAGPDMSDDEVLWEALHNDGEGVPGNLFEPGNILMYLGIQRNKMSGYECPVWLWGDRRYVGYIHPDDFTVLTCS